MVLVKINMMSGGRGAVPPDAFSSDAVDGFDDQRNHRGATAFQGYRRTEPVFEVLAGLGRIRNER